MKFMFSLILELLLAFAFSVDHVFAQSPPGYIGGMVCGLRENNSYEDPITFTDLYTDGGYDGKVERKSICLLIDVGKKLHSATVLERGKFSRARQMLGLRLTDNTSIIYMAFSMAFSEFVVIRYADFTLPSPPPLPGESPRHEIPATKKKAGIIPILALVAALFATFISSTLLCVIIWRKRRAVQRVMTESNGNNGGGSCIEPKLRQFTFSEVMSFIAEKKILGGGGFGNVYHGCMNGVEVAVKVLKVSPEQETQDFQSEVKILATVHHRNLIRILGYCNEGINRAIIFELMENGNLKNHLSDRNPNVLSWELRLATTIGAAEGLEYLHHGCDPPIIHRDIKPENILLTKEFEAKLADLGLSRIFPVQTSRVIGTFGYLDPEYKEPCMLTAKIDVYSFGVVMLVVVTGKPAIQGTTHITQWIGPKIRDGDIRGIVDPRLDGNYNVNMACKVVELAMACVSSDASSRPDMHYVVRELKECLPKPQARQEGDDTRLSNDDAAGITVTP